MLLPAQSAGTMERASITALATRVAKIAIFCSILSTSHPFTPSRMEPTITTERKMSAKATRKMRDGGKGRTGLMFSINAVWIRFNCLCESEGISWFSSSSRTRV